MAILHRELVDIPLALNPADSPHGPSPVRALLVRPKNVVGRLPTILVWPDIFQLTPSHVRVVERLAGHGFVVIAPEIYARIEPPGSTLDFDVDRQRALDDSAKVELAWVDEERRAVLDFALSRPEVDPHRLGACGFCFGGHLAFRAALEPEIRSTVCFYATGVHSGDLGASKGNAGTLARASEIRGSLVLNWGAQDPHIPAASRGVIHRALEDANVAYEIRLYDAAHAFVRDVGERYDPEAADRALRDTIEHFRRAL